MKNIQLENALAQNEIKYTKNENLAEHTSFKIGGPAAFFCVPENILQLKTAISAAKSAEMPYFILGNGTNVLFKDSGYNGLVIHINSTFNSIEIDGKYITAGSGASLKAVCTAAADAGLSGLEFAYGIPGSVGGAAYMNAGAYGGEIGHVLTSASVLDESGEVHDIPSIELELGYRTSVFHSNNWCILAATFCLALKDATSIKTVMDEYMSRREEKQPLDLPSAGSTFKRPQGAYAGELIDRCGLRGYQIGGAAISEKHCGFIVNMGGATCKDVLALAEYVSKTVKEKTGYNLEMEIRVIEESV